MSDLFCAATLVVARHGQAAYDVPDVASDDGGWLTPDGRQQARALGESLRDRRIASVWCSDMTRAVQTAEIAAGVLGGLPVTVSARAARVRGRLPGRAALDRAGRVSSRPGSAETCPGGARVRRRASRC